MTGATCKRWQRLNIMFLLVLVSLFAAPLALNHLWERLQPTPPALGGDIGLVLACYNAGPSVVSRPMTTWANETRRYYNWGTHIYLDTLAKRESSEHITDWLNAGGIHLCNRAARELGLR